MQRPILTEEQYALKYGADVACVLFDWAGYLIVYEPGRRKRIVKIEKNIISQEEIDRRKQECRERDNFRLTMGLVSRDELRRENGIFSPFKEVKVNLKNAKPLR